MTQKTVRKGRAYSVLTIKAVDGEQRIIRGTATTPTPDREGDIVEPLGIKFANPIPLLHQHRSDRPVGTVMFDKPTAKGITFEARLPIIPDGEDVELKERVDLAWSEVKHGLVRAVSIGFRCSEYSWMDSGGIRYIESEVLELSLVTIPANAEATITQIRSIDTAARAASGRRAPVVRLSPAAVAAPKHSQDPRSKDMAKKPIAEQIAAFENTVSVKTARMEEIMEDAAEKGETLDAAAREEYDTLASEVKAVEEHIVLLRDHEKRAIAKAKAVEPTNKGDNGARMRPTDGGRVASNGSNAPHSIRSVGGLKPGVGFVRMLSAKYLAREQGISPAEVALSKGWGDDLAHVLRMPQDIIQRAAINPATTVDSTWAGPLVTYNNLQNEFIELLRPRTLVARIPGLRNVPFATKIPRQTGGHTAYWVGQGSPVPASAGALDTVTLDFAKVAGMTFMTKELMRLSSPAAEPLLTESLVAAVSYLIDRDFLDPAKAEVVGVSPASVTNGSSNLTATGTSADAFRADFKSLLRLYTTANISLSGLVFAMTQTQAMSLGLMRNDFGTKEFPDINMDGGFIEGFPVVTTENIVANGGSPADGSLIAAISARDILLADDGTVELSVSTEASIQMESAPDSPTTAATTLVSLFQNDMVAIKAERMMTWKKARSNAVVYITGGNYA